MRKLVTPFLVLCLVGLTARLGYQMARSPVLPEFARGLGAAPELLGLILGASTITGVFIKLPAGALSDVLGRRKMLLLGAAFFAFPPFFYLLVTDAYALLGLRFLHGFATAVFSPVASAAVADLFVERRGERLGWFASMNEVGSTIAPVVGGAILAVTASNFQFTYTVIGVIGIATFTMVLALPVGEASVPGHPTVVGQDRWARFRQGIGEVVRNQAILVAAGAESALFLAVGALVGFLPVYGREVIGLTTAQVGLLLGAQLITAMAGKPVTGRISDRVGRKPVIATGLVLCAVMLGVVPYSSSFELLALELVLFGLGMAIVTPSTTALVTDLSKTGGYGAAPGVFGTIWDIGEAFGPVLAGGLLSLFAAWGNAYRPTFVIIAAVLVAFTMAFVLSVRDPTRLSDVD